MKMKKIFICNLCCILALFFPQLSFGADYSVFSSEVRVGLARESGGMKDLSNTFNAVYYMLTDANGKVVEYKALDKEFLSNTDEISFKLNPGGYKLYIMGEGCVENFTHPTLEVQTPSSVESIWFKNIRFQPVKREVFYAVEEINVDPSGNSVNLVSELVRKNGTVEVQIPSEITEVLSVVILIPDAYIANAMAVDGSLMFQNDTNGTGYYWTYSIKKDASDGIYRAQFLPSLEYSGKAKPRLIITGMMNGTIKNIETDLDGFVVESNQVTKVKVSL